MWDFSDHTQSMRIIILCKIPCSFEGTKWYIHIHWPCSIGMSVAAHLQILVFFISINTTSWFYWNSKICMRLGFHVYVFYHLLSLSSMSMVLGLCPSFRSVPLLVFLFSALNSAGHNTSKNYEYGKSIVDRGGRWE